MLDDARIGYEDYRRRRTARRSVREWDPVRAVHYELGRLAAAGLSAAGWPLLPWRCWQPPQRRVLHEIMKAEQLRRGLRRRRYGTCV